MRLVGYNGEAFTVGSGKLLDRLEGKRKRLDGANNDLLAAGQSLRQLAAFASTLALDGRHHASRPREIEHSVLELCIEHIAVGDDEYRVEKLLSKVIMQVGKEVSGPGDRVRLARACRVLDEISTTGPFG